MKIQISTTVLFFVLFALTHVELFAQVPEIPRPYLRGFARVSAIRGQPVIYYNPVAIRRVGPQVSQFIRAHEYAHLRLGHFNRRISLRQAEYEADVLASRSVPLSSIRATQQWFARGNGGGLYHGSGLQRARRIGYGVASRHR